MKKGSKNISKKEITVRELINGVVFLYKLQEGIDRIDSKTTVNISVESESRSIGWGLTVVLEPDGDLAGLDKKKLEREIKSSEARRGEYLKERDDNAG